MAKSNQARVNGGSNYDSLKVAKCLVIVSKIGEKKLLNCLEGVCKKKIFLGRLSRVS